MKATKARELRNMSVEELLARLRVLRAQLRDARFKRRLGQLEDKNLVRYYRREIARVLTVLWEKGVKL
ncbi:MAG: 50S ribosomal protein L29 [Candidatus Caldipriscus sp.]|jgi:large subunit ribosomal protein L29|nr:50S ribosomal protein L29 [Candidatus Caldipriscus sp.]